MKQIMINIITQFYEVLLRLVLFLVASLGVTQLMTMDSLTGYLWVSANHVVYGILLADIGLLLTIPIFSFEAFRNVLYNIIGYFTCLADMRPLKGLDSYTFPSRLSYLLDYVKAMRFVNLNKDLDVPIEEAVKGLEIAVKLIEEPDLMEAPLSDKTTIHETHTVSNVRIERHKAPLLAKKSAEIVLKKPKPMAKRDYIDSKYVPTISKEEALEKYKNEPGEEFLLEAFTSEE
jgi:hypothetical protein